MASELGQRIQTARKAKGLGLRELARTIEKSPSLISRLENEEPAPSVSPDTLRDLANALGLDPDEVLLLANRAGHLAPQTDVELALYRRMRLMSEVEKRRLLASLNEPRSK